MKRNSPKNLLSRYDLFFKHAACSIALLCIIFSLCPMRVYAFVQVTSLRSEIQSVAVMKGVTGMNTGTVATEMTSLDGAERVVTSEGAAVAGMPLAGSGGGPASELPSDIPFASTGTFGPSEISSDGIITLTGCTMFIIGGFVFCSKYRRGRKSL